MKLKQGIDFSAFLHSAKKCRGEIWFVTEDGDQLNLKSLLSEYLFVTAAISSKVAEHGYIKCQLSEDFVCIQKYLREE